MSTITVGQIMSVPAIAIDRSASLAEARAKMEEARVRHFAVVDAEGRVVGELSQRDLAIAAAVEETVAGRRPTLRVGDVMARDVYTARRETPAHEAAARMFEHRIGSLPVTDERGHLVGILTATDLIDVARRALLGRPLAG